jgi:inosine/guanosine/xanthosine phosphorylase family protein
MNKETLAESLRIVRRHFRGCRPACGLVLGSGWEAALVEFNVKKSISYSSVPALGRTTVAGHHGRLHWAELSGMETLVFQGRRHWYEGAGWEPVALPIYILKGLGATAVILTNSAGGIRSDLRKGVFMAIKDHINAMTVNPLQGGHDEFWGKRFADQTEVYDPGLRFLLKQGARRLKIALAEGVYLAVPGPAYETPAEIRAFRRLGADAVGMSTVPEAILAGAAGLRVVGVSLISNRAAGLSPAALDHEEVRQTGRAAGDKIRLLIRELWKAMGRKKREKGKKEKKDHEY